MPSLLGRNGTDCLLHNTQVEMRTEDTDMRTWVVVMCIITGTGKMSQSMVVMRTAVGTGEMSQ